MRTLHVTSPQGHTTLTVEKMGQREIDRQFKALMHSNYRAFASISLADPEGPLTIDEALKADEVWLIGPLAGG